MTAPQSLRRHADGDFDAGEMDGPAEAPINPERPTGTAAERKH